MSVAFALSRVARAAVTAAAAAAGDASSSGAAAVTAAAASYAAKSSAAAAAAGASSGEESVNKTTSASSSSSSAPSASTSTSTSSSSSSSSVPPSLSSSSSSSPSSSSTSTTATDLNDPSRTVKLFVFDDLPRGMPPGLDLEGRWGDRSLRAVQRAAWHPWRDAAFWRNASKLLAAAPTAELPARDLAQVCLAFRRIEYVSPDLVACCKTFLEQRQRHMNIFELAAVASYCSVACNDDEAGDLIGGIVEEVCNSWRQRESVPWSAWRMLTTSAAQTNVANQQLFALAAPQLGRSVQHMSGRDAVEICSSFATFRFRHTALLEEMARFLPSMGLTDREVRSLSKSFAELNFEAPLLQRLGEVQGLRASAGAAKRPE